MIERLSLKDRLTNQEKAYESMLNLQPAQDTRQGSERGALKDSLVRNVARGYGAGESDTEGRTRAKGMFGEGSQALGELQSKQQSEQDSLSFQGANQKESMIGQRQITASTNFARERANQNRALQEVVAQRAFDLGMQSKELSFHNNALVADAGFEALKRDFEGGRVAKREMLTILENQAMRTQKRNDSAEQMLLIRFNEAKVAISKGDIETAKQILKESLDNQRQIANDAARANNISGIVGGATQAVTTILNR